MTNESFAAELKKARLENQISLMDISASTRINIKFLEAIEEGNFSILPQAYVRAFIREYAEAVGYNGGEAIRKYDALRQAKSPDRIAESQTAPVGRSSDHGPRKSPDRLPTADAVVAFVRQNALFVALVVVVGIFVMYLVRPTSDADVASEIAETPFDKVVREHEAAAPKQEEPITLPAVTNPATVDSLTLEMTTSDSVWMTVTLDDSRTLEYLFPPNRKGVWKAKERFSLTMGNAGGANFTLNGHDLGSLGKRGAVVRNVLISEANLPNP